jgi:hypothetical protein
MNIDLKQVAMKVGKVWKRLGNPILGFLGVILFLALFVSASVRSDLWLQLEHLLGIMLVVIGAVFVILLACWFLFDAFLSFREFGQALRKWEAGYEPTQQDALYVLAMAIRSGLVFLGICVLAAGALLYLDL